MKEGGGGSCYALKTVFKHENSIFSWYVIYSVPFWIKYAFLHM